MLIQALAGNIPEPNRAGRETTWPTLTLKSTIRGAGATNAYGINDAGVIVGQYNDSITGRVHGFEDTRGSFVTIDDPKATGTTQATSIANNGTIGGYYEDGSGQHGFVDKGGTFTTIDAPFPGVTATSVTGTNSNEIVGTCVIATTSTHGFVDDGGTFSLIDFPGAIYTAVTGINARGEIVGGYSSPTLGSHGFIYDGSSFTTVDVPGALGTAVQGISNNDILTGVFNEVGSGDLSFVDVRGTFTQLDPAFSTDAHAVNNQATVVGGFFNGLSHGFVASA